MNFQKVASELSSMQLSLERERGVVEALANKGSKALELAEEARNTAVACEQAAKLLGRYSDEQQAKVISTIESIASIGLSQVFGEEISLVITQEVRANRPELDIKIRSGEIETPILDARGGGLAAVAGFLLRVCVILLTPEASKLLVLDETFAMLSEEYLDNMGAFIHELCQDTGLQIVMVTHQAEFIDHADKVYRIEKVGTNTSKFVEETK